MKTILCALLLLGLAACSGSIALKSNPEKRSSEVEVLISLPEPDAGAKMAAFCGSSPFKIISVESKFAEIWMGNDGVPHIVAHAYLKFECATL